MAAEYVVNWPNGRKSFTVEAEALAFQKKLEPNFRGVSLKTIQAPPVLVVDAPPPPPPQEPANIGGEDQGPYRHVPLEMRREQRWICWKTDRDGKKQPHGTDGQPLKGWREPGSWMTFTEARAAVQQHGLDGLGFVLGDGWGGLDLDGCRDPRSGTLDPRALALVAHCGEAYAEVSPSGEGLKVFGRGDGWLELTFLKDGSVKVEPKSPLYFAVTGQRLGEGRSALTDLPYQSIAGLFQQSAERSGRKEPIPAVVVPGTQNSTMYSEMGRMRRGGHSPASIAAAVWALIQEGRFPPEAGKSAWTKANVLEMAERVCARYPSGEKSADPFETDDTGNAEFFAASFADRVKYDHRQGRWLVWDDVRWTPDTKDDVMPLLIESARRRVALALGIEDNDLRDKRLKKLAHVMSRRKLEDARALAKTLSDLKTGGDEWDADPWLLGVPNGVVDLRTGTLRPGRPEDRITMQAAFPFDSDAKCPLWEDTLAQIFEKDPDLVPYIWKALGYSITGDVREEVFFLCTSAIDAAQPGREGKGTIMNTVAKVLGDYWGDLGFHSLEKSANADQGATPDLAKLVHKRFVTASETSGGRFNESRLKKMTGRDPITCRFLHQNEFTYSPEFKLWLAVNTLPRVRDEAFWSRPHRIPFRTSFRGNERKDLKDRLLLEGPGILAWLVRGCLEWQRGRGLGVPAAVTKAVEEYRVSQEPLAEFYESKCVESPEAFTPTCELRIAYLEHCREQRINFILGPKRFSQELAKRFKPGREATGERRTGFQGLGRLSGSVM